MASPSRRGLKHIDRVGGWRLMEAVDGVPFAKGTETHIFLSLPTAVIGAVDGVPFAKGTETGTMCEIQGGDLAVDGVPFAKGTETICHLRAAWRDWNAVDGVPFAKGTETAAGTWTTPSNGSSSRWRPLREGD